MTLPNPILPGQPDSERNFRELDNRFPVKEADIQDGAVTDDKLDTRIVRGEVAANGSVSLGSGFSASNDATGIYTVTFDTAFASEPIVVATNEPGASGADMIRLQSKSTSAFSVLIQSDGGVSLNAPFNFVVIEA